MKINVIVDVQNDFVTGVLGTEEAKVATQKIIERVKEIRKSDEFLIYTQDTHQSDYLFTPEGRSLPIPHCLEGTKGWEVVALADEKMAPHIQKPTFGSLELLGAITELNGKGIITEIELFGFCTDICVISNALILKNAFPLLTITVNADLCAGTTPDMHEAALKVMNSCQINIKHKED